MSFEGVALGKAKGKKAKGKIFTFYFLLFTFYLPITAQMAGCVSDKLGEPDIISCYQQNLVNQGPQKRIDTEGQDSLNPLGLLRPARDPKRVLSDIKIVTDPNTGKKTSNLTVEQAVVRALANSPEIRVISFDPSIVKQDITKAAAEFDVSAFGRLNFEQEDNPVNSNFQPPLFAQAKRKYQEAIMAVDRMALKSPIDGRIEEIHVETGESVNTLAEVVRIVQIDPLWVDVHVPIAEANVLSYGKAASVGFPDPNGASIEGKIIYIAAVANAASGTLKVRIKVPNKSNRPAGEHVEVTFQGLPEQIKEAENEF